MSDDRCDDCPDWTCDTCHQPLGDTAYMRDTGRTYDMGHGPKPIVTIHCSRDCKDDR